MTKTGSASKSLPSSTDFKESLRLGCSQLTSTGFVGKLTAYTR